MTTPQRQDCPDDHAHDRTSVCYVQHRCGCEPCRTANRDRTRQRTKLKAYGRWDTGLVDAGPVREHLEWLTACGLGYKRIAELAGISTTGVRTLLYGRQDPGPRYGERPKRTSREKAAAILALQPDPDALAGGARVSARGTHRRIRALVTAGWSLSQVARALGVEASNFSAVLQRPLVTASTARATAALFEQLLPLTPSTTTHRDRIRVSRARNHAARRGWLPAAAWDDIDADPTPGAVIEVSDDDLEADEELADLDPVDEPPFDEIAVALALSGYEIRLDVDSRREAVHRLTVQGWEHQRIALWLRTTPETVAQDRRRLAAQPLPVAQ